MAENRNASPQSVKDDTFDGDRLVGSGNGMDPGYARGVTAPGGPERVRASRRRPERTRRSSVGGLEGAEVGEVLVDLEAAVRGAPRRPAMPNSGRAGRLAAAGHHHRAAHLAEVVVGAVGGAALVEAGLVVGAAGEVHGAVLAGHEPVADVGVEGVGAGDVERRLGGEVGQGRLVGRRTTGVAGGRPRRAGCRPRRRGARRSAGRSARRARGRRRCPGAACSASSRAAPPIEWPTPSSSTGLARRGRRPRRAGRRASPSHGSGRAGRHHRGAVGAEVDRPALEPVAERGGHRLPHGAVEAGGVAEERRAAVAAVLVHGQRDAVGGGHRAHRCILVGRRAREANSVGAMPDPAADEEHSGDTAAEAEVRPANRRFYDAFEARDLDAMSDVWEHDDRVSCTHPGWRTLHGWGAVSGSWFALFGGPQPLQFILTDEHVAVAGDAAWVTVDENLISAEGERHGGGGERVRARAATAGGSSPTTARRWRRRPERPRLTYPAGIVQEASAHRRPHPALAAHPRGDRRRHHRPARGGRPAPHRARGSPSGRSVSVRSVFQHFDDLETLHASVAERLVDRVAVLVLPVPPDLPLAERLDRFVHQRALLLEAVTPIRRAADVHGPFSPEITARLRDGQAFLRAELERTFEPELRAAGDDARRRPRLPRLRAELGHLGGPAPRPRPRPGDRRAGGAPPGRARRSADAASCRRSAPSGGRAGARR